nr:hypothetical protein [Candidatus Baldrarchaeota archaeon]
MTKKRNKPDRLRKPRRKSPQLTSSLGKLSEKKLTIAKIFHENVKNDLYSYAKKTT